jgi:hypothetical protein
MSETTHTEIEASKGSVQIKSAYHDIDIIIDYDNRLVRIDGDIQHGDFDELVSQIRKRASYDGFYRVI